MSQLGQNALHHIPGHASEAHVETLVFEVEALVVDAEQMHDRGIQVMHVDAVADDVVAVVVGFAVDVALFDTGSGEEEAVAAWVMIATVVGLGERALRVDGAAEFAAPDDEGVIEQAALLEVFDQSGGGLVGVTALAFDGVGQAAVMVPAHVKELDAAHIALGESAGEQAVRSVGAGLRHIRPIHVQDVLRLVFGVHEVGHAHLHAESHLVLRDAGGRFGVAKSLEVFLIQSRELIEHLAAHGTIHTGGIREVEHGIARIAEAHAGVMRGQKAAAPEAVVKRLVIATTGAERRHDDVGRQIAIETAEAVAEPRANAGPSGELRTGLAKGDRGIVIDGLGEH